MVKINIPVSYPTVCCKTWMEKMDFLKGRDFQERNSLLHPGSLKAREVHSVALVGRLAWFWRQLEGYARHVGRRNVDSRGICSPWLRR